MIYLIRHADAVADEVDASRPLSPRGREQVARVAAALGKDAKFKPEQFWHSPLVRSRQTAELLARGLGLSVPIILTPGLEPDDDPERISSALEEETRSIAIVGHEPHLGVLASLLVHGPARAGIFYPFPKAGVLALAREGQRWRSEWIVRSP
jgi:phosphohistidine phosphatase